MTRVEFGRGFTLQLTPLYRSLFNPWQLGPCAFRASSLPSERLNELTSVYPTYGCCYPLLFSIRL